MTGKGIFLFLIVTLNWGKIEIVQIPGIVVQRLFNQGFQRVWPIHWKIQRNVAHTIFEKSEWRLQIPVSASILC